MAELQSTVLVDLQDYLVLKQVKEASMACIESAYCAGPDKDVLANRIKEVLPAIELEKTTRRTDFLFLATLLSTLLVPFTAGSMRSLCNKYMSVRAGKRTF